MRLKIWLPCALLLLTGQPLSAQQPPADPFGEHVFPPELVMQHQQAIGLSEEQRKLIVAELQKAQVRFTEVQFQLQHEMESLTSLVSQDRVDEPAVLAQLDKVLSLEREIKRAHMALIVRIKNSLTPDQQTRLREIRRRQPMR